MQHAVWRLRQARLASSSKPFQARGGNIRRCGYCLVPATTCICDQRPAVPVAAGFCLLMYDTEPLKPSNTGRLIADIAPQSTQAFLWRRTEPDPQLLALLADPQWQPYVVFPAQYAHPGQQVVSTLVADHDGRRPLFILLDGTWTEAKKMFRKSPYLAALPVLTLAAEQDSGYGLRKAKVSGQLCTAEVGVKLLDLHHEQAAARALEAWFLLFRDNYLAARTQHAADRE